MTNLDELLARQRGLLTRAQLLAAGVPASHIDGRVRARVWTPVLPRTYLVHPGLPDDELRVRAAVLWAGADAALAGLAAAWWLGLVSTPPTQVRVVTPHRARALRRAEVVADVARPVWVVEVREVRVTAPLDTLVDAALELGAAGVALLRDLRHKEVGRNSPYGARIADHRVVARSVGVRPG
ncbi:hypothetical protein ACQEVB_12235 [Pseudonocardia sp. CA-107938]|uniref:hypothetical protein n=1 Tax=Pseudonocardia sp. CA-107938 TaxID=3240021 RepID=UPI003D93BC12